MAEIEHIFSSLIPPRADDDNDAEPIHGATLPLSGDLFAMLANIYDRADQECTIPIQFVSDGKQSNAIRTAFIDLVAKPHLKRANSLGKQLSNVTTGRSGLGLLFFVIGTDGKETKLLVSRFPANQGILAEMGSGEGLTVEYVERVFMKNAATYKAALYRSKTPAAEFWDGSVVDKQINESAANYWINGFLQSVLRTTSKAGSRRLAVAMRQAAKTAESVDDKHQLVSAISLIAGLKGKVISPREVFDRFGLSNELRHAILEFLPNDEALDASFVLDADEFRSVAAFRSVKLNTGGVLTAATEDFDEVFERQMVDERRNRVRYTTVGTVVDEKVKSTQS